MSRPPLFVYGFPSLYGGANTELHHQIYAWLGLGLDVHLIPPHASYLHEPLRSEMIGIGAVVHRVNDLPAIERGAPVVGYCSEEFLANIDMIRRYSTNTVWINCMSHVWRMEKRRMAEGKIRTFLYQNDDIRRMHARVLCNLHPSTRAQFMCFTPFFDSRLFPRVDVRDREFFGCGRISRAVPDKYAANVLRIYDEIAAPKPKRGLFLGYNQRCRAKIGLPPSWIRIARNHLDCSSEEFYRHCEIVLQPSDTNENWPRIGLEAMSSGSVLIVDNRGGWQRQVNHGVTGWLCNNEGDFVHYASKMAAEPSRRLEMADKARARVTAIAGEEVSWESWRRVLRYIM
jgi:hypothetical protein